MKCPSCKKVVESAVIQRLPARTGQYGGTVKAVAYCCTCGFILGVESDPLERQTQLKNMMAVVAELQKFLDEEKQRRAARALQTIQPPKN